MSEYQVIARKYRPQNFQDVFGQNRIVTTLRNAIKRNAIARAYLFCGARGTGKTTLARLLAKALNCLQLTADYEPCNQCASCREITSGRSLDVLEVDGASNRGIEDIRKINETVGYAPARGKYKIYIIDEVHMLTKEAFNALLKTLEEPPPHVKFFFATTEPYKIPTTILSRCQRFNLNRIPSAEIIQKLRRITTDLNVSIEEQALQLVANRSEGCLRDAESLLDQILAFHEGSISAETVEDLLGIVPAKVFFELDRAGKEGNLAKAFEIAHRLLAEGKELGHIIDGLCQHYQQLLRVKLVDAKSSWIFLSDYDRTQYEQGALLYSAEQCVRIVDFLLEAQTQARNALSARITLEATLLRIMRIHQQVPVDLLVHRLVELEQRIIIHTPSSTSPIAPNAKVDLKMPILENAHSPNANFQLDGNITTIAREVPKVVAAKESALEKLPESSDAVNAELVHKHLEKTAEVSVQKTAFPQMKESITKEATPIKEPPGRHDTLLQFAAVELEGTIQRKK